MRMRCFLVLSLLASICLGVCLTKAQDSSSQVERKILKQITPRYPEIARRMNLAGTVKVIAVVTPDGKVKAVEPVGGNPVLIQAAQDAISQWKFVPASAESREVVELHFNAPQQ
jgi:TonB family protein